MKRISIILVLSMLLVITGLVFLGREGGDTSSIYSSGPYGYRICHEYLVKQGLDVVALKDSPGSMPTDALLFIAGPFSRGFNEQDVDELWERLQAGLNVVFLLPGGRDFWTTAHLGARFDMDLPDFEPPSFQSYEQWKNHLLEGEHLTVSGGWLGDSDTINQRHSYYSILPGKDAVPMLQTTTGRPSGHHLTVGKGTILFLSNSTMFSNFYFPNDSNADFFETLVNNLGKGRSTIFFDEYHHGHSESGVPAVALFSFWFIVSHLVLLFLLFVYTLRRSFRAPEPAEGFSAFSFKEFSESIASIHMSARHEDQALSTLDSIMNRLTGRGVDTKSSVPSGKSFLKQLQHITLQEARHGKQTDA